MFGLGNKKTAAPPVLMPPPPPPGFSSEVKPTAILKTEALPSKAQDAPPMPRVAMPPSPKQAQTRVAAAMANLPSLHAALQPAAVPTAPEPKPAEPAAAISDLWTIFERKEPKTPVDETALHIQEQLLAKPEAQAVKPAQAKPERRPRLDIDLESMFSPAEELVEQISEQAEPAKMVEQEPIKELAQTPAQRPETFRAEPLAVAESEPEPKHLHLEPAKPEHVSSTPRHVEIDPIALPPLPEFAEQTSQYHELVNDLETEMEELESLEQNIAAREEHIRVMLEEAEKQAPSRSKQASLTAVALMDEVNKQSTILAAIEERILRQDDNIGQIIVYLHALDSLVRTTRTK